MEDKEAFRLYPEKYGAESNQNFYNRCISVFKDISKYKNVLIVSHGGVYRNLYRYVNNLKDITCSVPLPENCSISEF